MKLSKLHETFISHARKPMSFGKLPIDPVTSDIIIIPTTKWEKLESPLRIHKTFKFMSAEMRNFFVIGLFEYELKTRHNASIIVNENEVTLDIRTKDIDQITELDKEYANFANILFKDIVYCPVVDNEHF